MLRIGAHVSISGGVQNAVDRQVDLGGNCGQIFVGSPRTWAVSDVDDADAAAFQTVVDEQDVRPWIVHGTYLINLATPKEDLGEKSVTALQAELDATAALDIPYYVFHPGAHTGAGAEAGVENVGERLSALDIPPNVELLLENTAGKGTTVGRNFAELDRMVAVSDYGYDDIGVCLDTCHLFSAGIDFRTADDIDALIADFDDTIGLENLSYIHLNDSKHPFGAEKDEHEHIGEGEIGDEGFRTFINHEAIRDRPMVLETPDDEKGYAWNIDHCKSLYS